MWKSFEGSFPDEDKIEPQPPEDPEQFEAWILSILNDKSYEKPRSSATFFGDVVEIYGDAKAAAADLPASEKIGRYKEVAKHARKLAHAIRGTKLDEDPIGYFAYCPFHLLPLEWRTRKQDNKDTLETLWENWNKVSEVREKIKALGLNATISKLLKNLQVCADVWPEDEANLSNYIRKPRAKMAQANYFIRAMSEIFKKHLGSVSPRLLARLASAALDDPGIDETTVGTSLKEWNKTSKTSLKT